MTPARKRVPSDLQNSALEPCARGGLRRSCGAVNTWVHVNSVPRSNIMSAPRVQGTTAAEVVTGRICESQHPRQFDAWLLRACAPLVCGRASVLGLENVLHVVVPFCVALCDWFSTEYSTWRMGPGSYRLQQRVPCSCADEGQTDRSNEFPGPALASPPTAAAPVLVGWRWYCLSVETLTTRCSARKWTRAVF